MKSTRRYVCKGLKVRIPEDESLNEKIAREMKYSQYFHDRVDFVQEGEEHFLIFDIIIELEPCNLEDKEAVFEQIRVALFRFVKRHLGEKYNPAFVKMFIFDKREGDLSYHDISSIIPPERQYKDD